MPPLLLLWGGRSGSRLIIPSQKIHLFSALVVSPPTDCGAFEYFWLRRAYCSSLRRPEGNLQDRDSAWHSLLIFFKTVLISAPLQEQTRKKKTSPPRAQIPTSAERSNLMKRRRENINKNIKRRHLLFDCCVHLYTSLHHYGLFSLQIKPKIVQITRRLKSF